jgi:hypothetical protein
VLDLLLKQEWVTTSDFLNAGLYTFRNRTSEINRRMRARGMPEPIMTEEIQPGEWGYSLVYDPRRV